MRYTEIKQALIEAQIIDEVKMSPKSFSTWVNSPASEGMLMGVEFEMCVPNISGVGEPDWQPDYDYNERAHSIDHIIEFFREGDYSNLGRMAAERLQSTMASQYEEWLDEQVNQSDQIDELVREKLADYITPNDYEGAAREELGDDASDDDIEERSKELADEAISDELRRRNSRYYDRSFDEARDELLADMRNSGDTDEEAWLNDIGVDYMDDAANEWSLDWPHMHDANEGGGHDMQSLVDDFSEAMGGINVNVGTEYHGGTRDGKSWIIEPDSSIEPEDDNDAGLEFVSPPMPIKQGIEMIEQVKKWASRYGCYTNESTGLHMNISVPNLDSEKLDYVKLALFMGDEHILNKFGRLYNSMCNSAIKIIKDRIRSEEVPTILASAKKNLNGMASKLIHSGITNKYTSINNRSNYIEFRGPGGDYLDKDVSELIDTALRLSMSLQIATDPEAHKQEYAKKLYKLVEQEADPDNSVKLFSQYALGDISKDELTARLQFSRRERDIKKTSRRIARAINDPKIQKSIKELPYDWTGIVNRFKEMDDSRIENLLTTLTAGSFDDELSSEEKTLVAHILNNELAYRKSLGNRTQYWVTRRDGTGGKQLVVAYDQNEAILIGGKNIGLDRNQSIKQLNAKERVNRTPEQLLNGLPTEWREYVDKISDASNGVLRGGLDSMTTGRWQYRSLDDEEVDFIKSSIEAEMQSRKSTQSDVQKPTRKSYPAQLKDTINSFSPGFKHWSLNIPNHTESKLQETMQELLRGNYNALLTTNYVNIVINLIRDELAYREQNDTGPENGTVELQFKDESTNPHNLPERWQSFISGIREHENGMLIGVLNTVSPDDAGSRLRLDDQQLAYIRIMVKRELRNRGVSYGTELGREQQEQQAVDMQTQLIQRDDPVSSNDDEAQSPVGDFRIYSPAIRQTVNMIRQSTLSNAEAIARRYETELGLPANSLVVSSATRTAESIDNLKKLAGIRT